MRRLRFWIIASVFCWANAYGQVTQAWTVEPHQALSFRSAAGTCSGAGFVCDHVTLFTEGERQILQFSDNSLGYTHLLTFAGTPDPQDTAVIHVTEVVRDGKLIGSSGSCSLYQAGKIVCSIPSLTFTVTQ
jgi:hypothetical protein